MVGIMSLFVFIGVVFESIFTSKLFFFSTTDKIFKKDTLTRELFSI